MICFEYLSLPTFLLCFFKFNILKKLFSIRSNPIYFIESSFLGQYFLVPTITFFGKKISKLNFHLIEIKDNNGELIQYRIARSDLLEIKKKIIDSKSYKELFHQNWNQESIIDYVNKGIIDGGIDDETSVSRVLFLIEVLNWHMKRINCKQSLFILNIRPWFNIYKKIAANYKIELLEFRNIQFKLFDIRKIVRNNYLLYGVLKNIKYNKKLRMKTNINPLSNKLFLDGRGDLIS